MVGLEIYLVARYPARHGMPVAGCGDHAAKAVTPRIWREPSAALAVRRPLARGAGHIPFPGYNMVRDCFHDDVADARVETWAGPGKR